MYLGHYETSMMEHFYEHSSTTKKPLAIFTKSSIMDVWYIPKYASVKIYVQVPYEISSDIGL